MIITYVSYFDYPHFLYSSVPSLHHYFDVVMQKLLAEGLSFGASIEVFYNVSMQDGSNRKVWWPCTVERISFVQEEGGTTLTASVRYQPMLGFRSSTDRFVFRENQEVQDKYGTCYSWRFSRQVSDSEDTQTSSEEAHETDENYNPGNSQVLGKRRACELEQEGSHEDEQGLQNERDIRRLGRVVSTLERELNEQGRRLSQLQERAASSTRACESDSSRLLPLKFLCLRLRSFLEKIPSVPAKTSVAEIRNGFSFYNQKLLRRTSDCTLLQFDEIADHVHGNSEAAAEFYPSYEEFKKHPKAEVRIVFRTFASFVSVFTDAAPETLWECIIKSQVDRSSGTVLAIRFLGWVLQSSQESCAPMYLVVGGTAPKGSDGDTQMSVIVREDTTWNSIEGCFHNELQSISCPLSEFVEKAKLALGASEYDRHANKYSFCITWRKESDTELGRLLAPKPNRGDVLGLLEINLPYVLIRGAPQCHEFSLVVPQNKTL